MNIALIIGLVLLVLSMASLIALYQRIRELHKEKPHVIPAWLSFFILLVIVIHIISISILSLMLFFPEFMNIDQFFITFL